jgi:hypothetical protein
VTQKVQLACVFHLNNSPAAYSTDFRSCTFSMGGFFKSLSEEILEAFLKAFPSFLDVSYIM